jgi:hypothetical protein
MCVTAFWIGAMAGQIGDVRNLLYIFKIGWQETEGVQRFWETDGAAVDARSSLYNEGLRARVRRTALNISTFFSLHFPL